MNILLVGEESAGIQTLRALADSDHRIVAVMASPSKNNGGLANLWETAERLGYQTWPSKLVKDPRFRRRGTGRRGQCYFKHTLAVYHK